ncbi:MAG: hypothetical protein QG618_670, partial [Thermodesulfobacteriota bacterium]|nr:hypothetical protein [Thermodesulfobacteriota bacterium]
PANARHKTGLEPVRLFCQIINNIRAGFPMDNMSLGPE